MIDTPNPSLNLTQIAGLQALARDPAATTVEPATKSKLRKLGLVGKVVGKDGSGRQQTTSPVTEAGRAMLRELFP